jgi:ABC-type branched-subunit amino acid transport system substrate-binding protein
MTALAGLVAIALLATGCGGRDGSGGRDDEPTTGPGAAATGSFGTLTNVCGPGTPKTAPALGVTAQQVDVGVFSDVGFTQNKEFLDAARVFAAWCNDAGGINGRRIFPRTHDTGLLQVRQRMVEACKTDFALVGGGAALDALGVKERLECTLPDFPAQLTQVQNHGSDLQVQQTGGPSYSRYAGYFHWLLNEAYPESASHVGLVVGDSPVTKVIGAQATEALQGSGGTVVHNNLYPPIGVSDWTPYAQAIKNKGVRGLVFYGDFKDLARLEQKLTDIGYTPDWIDANSNAYGDPFLELAGRALKVQNNVADLGGVYPVEKAADNPATKQILDLYERFAPGTPLTLPAMNAFSAWLLFAKSATSCGENLTRTCVYEAAAKEKAWTGGGLRAPVDLTNKDTPLTCFNVQKATPDGWTAADFKPNEGPFRCGAETYEYTKFYGKPLTLADVGKSMSDVG